MSEKHSSEKGIPSEREKKFRLKDFMGRSKNTREKCRWEGKGIKQY